MHLTAADDGAVEVPHFAVVRRCDPQLVRRKPAIGRGRTRLLLAELDDVLGRPLMAGHGHTRLAEADPKRTSGMSERQRLFVK